MAESNEPPTSAPAPSTATEPAAEPTVQIAVDPHFQGDDNDSTLGDDKPLSIASIGSTILEYRKLHGRTYHNFKAAEYWGPNDEQQNEGLDINHHMLYLALDNKLFLAPLENPQMVLDVGTGTGIWAIDFADEFPEAEVTGIDLSPTQPTWVPPNCKFELNDASQEGTFPDNTFDYIHIRYMLGCFKDWSKLYKECFRCLKPGGWLEHLDCSTRVQSDDGSLPADSVWAEWREVFARAGEKTGQTFEVIDDDNWVKWMDEAGFSNIQTKTIKTPIGGWSADKKWKEVGLFNGLSIETGLEGFGLYMLTNVMGWEYAEVQVWLARVQEALKNKSSHGFTTWGSAWAQKPEA
ncbi:S-adenosyl-L-methionine-dependent methyltransferase [Thelonectria olida]|uniref:S-adenosyl-L-methionine-dependent methyltransferase n=1 Tax=Thelonectria olida TaxID=1576542 RepID=A0A9P8VY10_9HYPO|nr:S-adenosyl-L-methionine-dependent methyltransferase [Thelonectria olida]